MKKIENELGNLNSMTTEEVLKLANSCYGNWNDGTTLDDVKPFIDIVVKNKDELFKNHHIDLSDLLMRFVEKFQKDLNCEIVNYMLNHADLSEDEKNEMKQKTELLVAIVDMNANDHDKEKEKEMRSQQCNMIKVLVDFGINVNSVSEYWEHSRLQIHRRNPITNAIGTYSDRTDILSILLPKLTPKEYDTLLEYKKTDRAEARYQPLIVAAVLSRNAWSLREVVKFLDDKKHEWRNTQVVDRNSGNTYPLIQSLFHYPHTNSTNEIVDILLENNYKVTRSEASSILQNCPDATKKLLEQKHPELFKDGKLVKEEKKKPSDKPGDSDKKSDEKKDDASTGAKLLNTSQYFTVLEESMTSLKTRAESTSNKELKEALNNIHRSISDKVGATNKDDTDAATKLNKDLIDLLNKELKDNKTIQKESGAVRFFKGLLGVLCSIVIVPLFFEKFRTCFFTPRGVHALRCIRHDLEAQQEDVTVAAPTA